MQPRKEKRRNKERKKKERERKGELDRRVRRRVSWQKSETNEQCSVRRGFPCKCDRELGSRNGHSIRCDTQCFKESNRESEVLKCDKRRMHVRKQPNREDYERCNLPARY